MLIISGHSITFGQNALCLIFRELHRAASTVIVIGVSTPLQILLSAKRGTLEVLFRVEKTPVILSKHMLLR